MAKSRGGQPIKQPNAYPKYGVQKGWERVTAAKVEADGFVELTDEEAQQMGFRFEGLLYIVGYRCGLHLHLSKTASFQMFFLFVTM